MQLRKYFPPIEMQINDTLTNQTNMYSNQIDFWF